MRIFKLIKQLTIIVHKYVMDRHLRIKEGKKSAERLAHFLTLSETLKILELDLSGEFYCDQNITYLGRALHGYFLPYYPGDTRDPIFPRLYWEYDDEVSKIIWNHFLNELRRTMNYKK